MTHIKSMCIVNPGNNQPNQKGTKMTMTENDQSTPLLISNEFKSESVFIYAGKWLLAMLITAGVLMGAFALSDKLGMFDKFASSSTSTVQPEKAQKVGFTFTDQWNKIEVPNGTAIYSRCSPYADFERMFLTDGNLSIVKDLTCKKA